MVLKRIEKFLRESGMSPTSFGRRVARDPRLVHDLRRGREPGANMVQRIDAYIGVGR